MADKQDKTFDPTPRRIRKAREEGNVFRAKEIVSVGLLLVCMGLLAVGMRAAYHELEGLMRMLFGEANQLSVDAASVPVLLGEVGRVLAVLLLPLFGIVVAGAIGFNVVQSGWNLTFKAVEPKPSKINPLNGLKRIFSSRGLFEFGKGLVKILIVGPVAYLLISSRMAEISMLHTQPLLDIFGIAGGWIFQLSITLVLLLGVLSAADFAFERWRYKEDLKMSAQEIKDEAKESEGNPEVKRRRLQFARELLRRPRLDHAVLQADVVVTNPTHYAIALRYDPVQAPAPMVLVKGIRKRALRIKELARDLNVPTVENRPLARALYDAVPEGQEIPEDLYPAVAALLAEIYRARGR
ncbi:MAG: EscU/YscU/HrcU family type III secretion system export apparatus switch protein [Bacteroidota bacterium]